MCLAVAMYWPALTAPFVTDDYTYIWAAQDMDGGEVMRSVLGISDIPRGFISTYWRPAALLSFLGLHELF